MLAELLPEMSTSPCPVPSPQSSSSLTHWQHAGLPTCPAPFHWAHSSQLSDHLPGATVGSFSSPWPLHIVVSHTSDLEHLSSPVTLPSLVDWTLLIPLNTLYTPVTHKCPTPVASVLNSSLFCHLDGPVVHLGG